MESTVATGLALAKTKEAVCKIYVIHAPLYSFRPQVNAILIFREVKWFEFRPKLCKKVLRIIIQNK